MTLLCKGDNFEEKSSDALLVKHVFGTEGLNRYPNNTEILQTLIVSINLRTRTLQPNSSQLTGFQKPLQNLPIKTNQRFSELSKATLFQKKDATISKL